MRSYKERQFRKALSSPKLGFWPHCKNSDYTLLDDRQVCWVVQVRTGPELPGKQEQSSVVGRQLCTSMGRQAWRKGQLLVAWLLAVACGLRAGGCVWGTGGNSTSNPAELRLMGRGSGGVTGVLVVSNRPHTGGGHCAQTWSTRWLLDYTLECAVGAEWRWICTHTHTHTHTVKHEQDEQKAALQNQGREAPANQQSGTLCQQSLASRSSQRRSAWSPDPYVEGEGGSEGAAERSRISCDLP